MRKFIINLFLFASPVVLFSVIPASVLKISRESFSSIDETLSSKEKYLVGYAYHEKNYGYLKWAYLNANDKKEVWALGSSRVLQFRESMFDTTFYNAGYTISSISDFLPFLKSIPRSKYPHYIIMGLDQWMFNASWDNLKIRQPVEFWKKSFSRYPEPTALWKVYEDLYAGKYGFNSFQQDQSVYKVGLNAVVNNTGFRNDGSMYYGGQIMKLVANDSTANDYHYASTYSRIAQGSSRFAFGNSINDNALAELDNVLKFCKENNIQVVAFIPPFADAVYAKMVSSNHFDYLEKVYPAIKPVVEKYHYEVYDFSTVSKCNSSDQETIDGFHGGELTYQRLLISMLDAGSVLNRVVDVDKLKNNLPKRKNNYIIYDY